MTRLSIICAEHSIPVGRPKLITEYLTHGVAMKFPGEVVVLIRRVFLHLVAEMCDRFLQQATDQN
jgi:hypothetical protein